MSKIIKSIFVIAIIMFLSIVSCKRVYAAEASISFVGAREVEAGKTQSVSIVISNETETGVIQGKITGDANIEIENIEAKDDNWTVNYNSTTKEFNAYYANGIKSGEVLIVKYKLKAGATEGTITLSNIELTTITYETIKKTNIEKTVVAKAGSDNGNNNGSNNENNNGNSSGSGNNSGSSSSNGGSSSNSGSSSSSTGTKTQTKKSANGIIPKLGQNGLLIIAVFGSIVIAVISYRKLKGKK